MIILVPVLLVFLITVIDAIFEYSRLNSIASNTRDAMQSAMTQVCTDNSANVYTGVREGYAGGYKLENTRWNSNVSSSNIMTKVDAKLGTSDGVKMLNGKMVYKVSDISIDIRNAPLAPVRTDGVQQLTGTVTCTLTVPLSFGWSGLPPMVAHPQVKSGFSPQGEAAFGGGSDNPGTPVERINLSESAMTLEKGDTDVVAASVVPDDAENRKISWTSTDNRICKVSQTGAVTGVSVGSASVVALSESGKMAQCNVTVVAPVAGVSLDKTNVKLIKGASEQLTATVRPTDASNKGVHWASSDSSVCTVDSTGKITAVGAGAATVTVMTEEGGYFAECSVTVTIPVSGLTLDKTALKIAKGATDTLKATVYPSDATRPDVLWASSDDAVCTVDATGHITAVGVGLAIISATTMDGEFEADCDVNVVIPVTGISLSPSSLTLIKGTSGNLTATVSPADATDKTVFWTSSNSSVCTVDSSGRVAAVSVGTATVTAKTEDGGYTATASITVKPNTYTITANSSTGGTVYGGGVYNAGSNVTLTAQPYEHYHFVNWTNAAGTVVGYSLTYTIYNLSADTTVTANFAIDTFTINVYGSTGGSAYGSGTYPYGATIQLRADASPGYHFLNWSDGNVANPRYYIVYGNANLTAIFAPNPITWTFSTSETYSNRYIYSSQENRPKLSNTVSWDCDRGSGTGVETGTYTFTTPMHLAAGSTIRLAAYGYNWPPLTVLINGTPCISSRYGDLGYSGGDYGAGIYRVPQDVWVNTIQIKVEGAASRNMYRYGYQCIYITSPGLPSFMLNSTNTSEYQNCDNLIFAWAPSKSKDKHAAYVGSNYFGWEDSSKRYVYVHFLRPRSVSKITVGSGGTYYATSFTVEARHINGSYASAIQIIARNATFGLTFYPSNFSGVDFNNLTDLKFLAHNSRDGIDEAVTVYFTDGSSQVLGSATCCTDLG